LHVELTIKSLQVSAEQKVVRLVNVVASWHTIVCVGDKPQVLFAMAGILLSTLLIGWLVTRFGRPIEKLGQSDTLHNSQSSIKKKNLQQQPPPLWCTLLDKSHDFFRYLFN
jgi:hypothetical protein